MPFKNTVRDYSKQILIGILGGLCVTFILFIFNTFIHQHKNLTGSWKAYVKTEKTNYIAFKNLTCVFRLQIIQSSDNLISGIGEKIYDINPDGRKLEYTSNQRDIVHFKGRIDQPLIGAPNIFFEIAETGSKYKTTANYTLLALSNDSLSGTFYTTIADGSGQVQMRRE